MRKLKIIGNLGKDAVLNERETSSFLKFDVAVKERKKIDGNWSDVVSWHNITYWGNLPYLKTLVNYLKKGTRVYCDGDINVTVYNGNPSIEMACQNLEICSKTDR